MAVPAFLYENGELTAEGAELDEWLNYSAVNVSVTFEHQPCGDVAMLWLWHVKVGGTPAEFYIDHAVESAFLWALKQALETVSLLTGFSLQDVRCRKQYGLSQIPSNN